MFLIRIVVVSLFVEDLEDVDHMLLGIGSSSTQSKIMSTLLR